MAGDTPPNTLFIHTNRKQLFGAKLGKYSFERGAGPSRTFEVRFIIVEELPEMQQFVGTEYLVTADETRTYTFDDLQSFTLARFKPPELMRYQGRAIVIDPDIFALPGTDIAELFAFPFSDADLACVKRPNGKWETSLMVLECARLTSWKLSGILADLSRRKRTKQECMTFYRGERVTEIHSSWNSLDSLKDAKVLHTTNRLTQPWKTGLPIDFTPKALPKLFGLIPREPIHKLLGKYPTHFAPHPDHAVTDFFFTLAKQALRDGAITEAEIREEIAAENVRADFFEVLARY